ncbi:MAG: nucleotidyltransferase family protein [Clostridia bacterium]|nr:nucleotidyltransferase family protein [Clostridia bacterium]
MKKEQERFMTGEEILFALFRSGICGETLSQTYKDQITPKVLARAYKESKAHDLAHLACEVLDSNGLLSENTPYGEQFYYERQLAVCRFEQIDYEYKMLLEVLEQAKIPYLPLKGAITRAYYPQPWMRTSCDIDILVKPEDIQTAITVLETKSGYKQSGKTAHDVSLYSVGGVHVELHHVLIEEAGETQKVLANVWDYTTPMEGKTYGRQMHDEMFYFYHIAHMAKHFSDGGCGVRPFIDLWLLDNRVPHDTEKRDSLLKEGGLLPFAEAMRKLSRVWFSGEEHDELTLRIQPYVCKGGVYGNLENRVAMQQVKKGGKFRYAMSRIFLPYDQLKLQYPVLERKKWLTPVCEVRRWCRLIFCGRAKHSVRELNVNANMTEERKAEIAQLLADLAL